MRKIILLITVLGMTNVSSIMNASNITGIKPFTLYISKYHYIDQAEQDSYDVDIGKKIKVIEFDGSSIKVTKMGILEKKGSIIKCGPFLDKDMEPILINYNDKEFDHVMEDIITTYYQCEFIGDKNIFFAYNSKEYASKTCNGLLLTSGSLKWARTRIDKETIKNKSATAQFVILDDDKQYHYYEIEGGKLVLKHKLAINPDYFDKNLPYLNQMLPIYRSFWPRNYKDGYVWFANDNRMIVESGQKRYFNPPVMTMRNGVYYMNVYYLSKRLGYGYAFNKDNGTIRIVKMYNPNMYELSFKELILDVKDKSTITFNDEKKKLKNDWFSNPESCDTCPYISLREFSEMFGFKYSYRDIDKTVLIP